MSPQLNPQYGVGGAESWLSFVPSTVSTALCTSPALVLLREQQLSQSPTCEPATFLASLKQNGWFSCMSKCLCSSLMQQRALPLKDNRFRMIKWHRLKSSFWSHKEREKNDKHQPRTRLEEKSGRPLGSCVSRT